MIVLPIAHAAVARWSSGGRDAITGIGSGVDRSDIAGAELVGAECRSGCRHQVPARTALSGAGA